MGALEKQVCVFAQNGATEADAPVTGLGYNGYSRLG